MAILNQVPGLEVTICVDHKPLQEYKDDDESAGGDGARTARRYVEAAPEKLYAIRIELKTPFKLFSDICHGLLLQIIIDRQMVARRIMAKKQYGSYFAGNIIIEPIVIVIGGTRDALPGSGDIVHNFKFSKIETTHDNSVPASAETNEKRVNKVGEIVVHIGRVGNIWTTPAVEPPLVARSDKLKVHEKVPEAQAESYHTELGPSTSALPIDRVKFQCIDAWDSPYATFRFKYASGDELKSRPVVGQNPMPEPVTPASVAPSYLYYVDKGLQVPTSATKRERDNDGEHDNTPPNRAIKREHDDTPTRAIKREHGDTSTRTIKREHDDTSTRTIKREHDDTSTRTIKREHDDTSTRTIKREHDDTSTRTIKREHDDAPNRAIKRER